MPARSTESPSDAKPTVETIGLEIVQVDHTGTVDNVDNGANGNTGVGGRNRSRACLYSTFALRSLSAVALGFIVWFQYYNHHQQGDDVNKAGKQRQLTAEHFARLADNADILLANQDYLDDIYSLGTLQTLQLFLQTPPAIEYAEMSTILNSNVLKVEASHANMKLVCNGVSSALLGFILIVGGVDCYLHSMSPERASGDAWKNCRELVCFAICLVLVIGSFGAVAWSYIELRGVQQALSDGLLATIRGLSLSPLTSQSSRMNYECAYNRPACNLTALVTHDTMARNTVSSLMTHFELYDEFKRIHQAICRPSYEALMLAHTQGISTLAQVTDVSRICFEGAEWTTTIARQLISKTEALADFDGIHVTVLVVNAAVTFVVISVGTMLLFTWKRARNLQAEQAVRNTLLEQEALFRESVNAQLQDALALQSEELLQRQQQQEVEAAACRDDIRRSWFHNQGNMLSALLINLEEPVDLEAARARTRHTNHVMEIQRYSYKATCVSIGQAEDSCDFGLMISDLRLLFPMVEVDFETGKEAERFALKIKPPLLHVSLYQLIRNAFDHGGRGVPPVLSWGREMHADTQVLAIKLWNAPGKNHTRMLSTEDAFALAQDASLRQELGCMTSTGQGLADIQKYIQWQGEHCEFDIEWLPPEHADHGVVAMVTVPILRSSVRVSNSLTPIRMAFIDDQPIQRMAVRSLACMLNPHLKEDYKNKGSPVYIDMVACKDCTLQHPHIMVGCDGMEETPHSVTEILEWCTQSPRDTVIFLDRFLDGQDWLTEAIDGVTLIPLFAQIGCTVVMRSGNSEDDDRDMYSNAGAFHCIGKTMGGASGQNVIDRVRMRLRL